jgi:hypothetical protein
MKMIPKVVVAVASGVLSVGLATAGAFAATGSFSVPDQPGQALKLQGVAPAADHASKQALAHANQHAKGLFGTTSTAVPTPSASASASTDASTNDSDSSATTSATVTPVAPTTASKDASTVKGNLTGKEVSAWAKAHSGVQVVTPPAAVDVSGDAAAAGH